MIVNVFHSTKEYMFFHVKIDATGVVFQQPLDSLPSNTNLAVNVEVDPDFSGSADLSFLNAFNNIISFSFDGIDSNIEHFTEKLLNTSKFYYNSKKYKNLDFLLHFKNLYYVNVKMPNEDITIKIRKRLKSLYLMDQDCSKYDFREFKNIRSLIINGNCKGLTGKELAPLKKLLYLDIFHNTTFNNIEFFSELREIQAIHLDWVSKPEKFPDMSKCENLKYVHITTCGRLRNFEGLQYAPNLSHVFITNNAGYTYEEVACLANLKSLQKIVIAGKNKKVEQQLKELFGDKILPYKDDSVWGTLDIDLDQYPLE